MLLVSIDRVRVFFIQKVHCPGCTSKTFRNGDLSYQHCGLGAVVGEGFPIEFEPVLKQDGERKNDWERNDAKMMVVFLANQI